MICTMLRCVRSVPLDIWLVKLCIFSGLPALVGLPVQSHWACSYQYAAHQSAHLMPLAVLPVFQIFVINMPSLSLLQFVFNNSVSVL